MQRLLHNRLIQNLENQLQIHKCRQKKLRSVIIEPVAHVEAKLTAAEDARVALDKAFDAQTAEFFPGTEPQLGFVLLKGWLDEKDILAATVAAASPDAFQPGDRGKDLVFTHKVLRIEEPVYQKHPYFWHKIMETIKLLDNEVWHALESEDAASCGLYPEVEWITYDVAEQKGPCSISPHTDNEAIITIIGMLSHSDEYTGGESFFLSDTVSNRATVCKLERGDFVAFRGEKLTHWISPVLTGKRTILQIELARIQRGNSGSKLLVNTKTLAVEATHLPPPSAAV